MSTTTSAPPHTRACSAGRVAAISSVVFGISMFALVASVNVPREASDEKLAAFWRGSENLIGATVSAYAALLGAICLMVVVNHVRLLAASATAEGPLVGFARSMATLCAGSLVVVGAMRGALAHLVRAEDLPLPGPEVLRYATSLGYSLLDLGTMGLLGVTMLATSVLILRSKVLSGWVGVLGSACGVITLAAVAVGFGAFSTPVAIVWGIGLAVSVLRRGQPG